MTKRWMAPAATVLAGALVLTACGGGGNEAGGGGGDGAPLESLSIMAPYLSTTAPQPDDEMETALGDLVGLPVDVQWVPNSDYGDKTNTVLAGDDIPDVMVIQSKSQAFVQTALAGGFWDLTDYIASGDYPNLVSANPEVQDAASVNGQVFGIYRARDVIRTGIIIRGDWLTNLGLEAPKTTDDLMEIARAFTQDDPDGNGADDTYGMIMPAWTGIGNNGPYDAFDVWFGAGNMWRDDNGELVPSFTTDEWMQSMNYARDMVANGYVNPDYATMDATTGWNPPFFDGKGGIIIDVQSRAAQLRGLFRDAYPDNFDTYVSLSGQVSGPNGTFALPTTGYSGFLAIPKSSVQTEDQLKQVLTALNEMNSTEAQILLNNGIEGVNFTVEDGFLVNDPAQQEFTDLVTGAWAQLGTNVGEYNAYSAKPETESDVAFDELRLQLQATDEANAVFNPAAGLVSDTYTTNGTQLDNIIADARLQYIAGQIDEAGWQTALDTWRSSGGDDVTSEINELYQGN